MNLPPAPGDFSDDFPDYGDSEFQNISELSTGSINGTDPFSPNSVIIYVTNLSILRGIGYVV
jgi:hypothetical protein